MRSRVAVVVVVNLVLLVMRCGVEASTEDTVEEERNVARYFFENTLLQLAQQRRMFLEGFGNGTAAVERDYDFDDAAAGDEEARGRRKKKLRQMNRTLMAIAMAYTLKFIFLIPTFVGTLILLKFTTLLAGFFYALFAAVLGLDPTRNH